eukprot:6040559-Ditylum_brightwellii.AAC.1
MTDGSELVAAQLCHKLEIIPTLLPRQHENLSQQLNRAIGWWPTGNPLPYTHQNVTELVANDEYEEAENLLGDDDRGE